MFATRTQAQNAFDVADAERTTVEARVAASKRYRGRANDLRLVASLTEICWAATEALNAGFEPEPQPQPPHPGERAEAHIEALWNHRGLLDFPGTEAGDAERWDAVQEARRIERPRMAERLRERVATRAYFLALNGHGASDAERWLEAERTEFVDDAHRRHNYAEVRYHRGHLDPKPVPCTRFAGRDYYDENAYRH